LEQKPPLNNYVKYSTIGIQMAAAVVITTFLGKYLDSFEWFKFPVFTVIGAIIGVFAAMYYLIKKI